MVLVKAAVPDSRVENRTKKAKIIKSHLAQPPSTSENIFCNELITSTSQKELVANDSCNSGTLFKTPAPKKKNGSVPKVIKNTVTHTSVCMVLIQCFVSSMSLPVLSA